MTRQVQKCRKMAAPLARIRVLEMAGLAPVPMAGMILADFGASVIRVDKFGSMTGVDDRLARGKKSITVDLKKPKGIDIVKRLARKADVLIEPFRPTVMEKLGLGPDVLLKENEKLIYARLTGFGQHGPMSSKAGHDINYLAISGILSLIGRKGEKPLAPLNLVADFAGGSLTCVIGILMALFERNSSGKGQVIDCSMRTMPRAIRNKEGSLLMLIPRQLAQVEGTTYLASFMHRTRDMFIWLGERGTNVLDSGAPFYDTYETRDGKFVSVGAIEPKFYQELVEGLDLREEFPINLDANSWPKMRERFTEVFLSKTRDEWVEIFKSKDACFAPVLSMDEASKDQHNVSRNSFTIGSVLGKEFAEPRPAPKLSRAPALNNQRYQPSIGEHTIEVLAQEGFSKLEINQLLKEKVISQHIPSSSI